LQCTTEATQIHPNCYLQATLRRPVQRKGLINDLDPGHMFRSLPLTTNVISLCHVSRQPSASSKTRSSRGAHGLASGERCTAALPANRPRPRKQLSLSPTHKDKAKAQFTCVACVAVAFQQQQVSCSGLLGLASPPYAKAPSVAAKHPPLQLLPICVLVVQEERPGATIGDQPPDLQHKLCCVYEPTPNLALKQAPSYSSNTSSHLNVVTVPT